MSMYNDYTFEVQAVHPSGILSYQAGRAATTRQFKVSCEFAEEFALRMMGKFYREDDPPLFLRPILPVPFPFDSVFGTTNHSRGFLNLVATSFSILPQGSCCFEVEWTDDLEVRTTITDPTAFPQMERYFSRDASADNSECVCIVTIGYEENPCDCVYYDYEGGEWVAHAEILPGTCISAERNPAYEMFTLPNANLVWKNILYPDGTQVPLKADSYAYQIIPKADIIVHWHNVPVQALCQIETHLVSFRGTVNQEEWGESILCKWEDPTNLSGSGDDRIDCAYYEPETILFVDWQEDRSRRTDAFGGNTQDGNSNMNTTTLKLFFKQKRVEFTGNNSNSVSDDNDLDGDGIAIAGWNHMFTDNDVSTNSWRRVVVKSTQEPIFPLRAFSDIFFPVL